MAQSEVPNHEHIRVVPMPGASNPHKAFIAIPMINDPLHGAPPILDVIEVPP